MALAARDAGDFAVMPYLADALEESGWPPDRKCGACNGSGQLIELMAYARTRVNVCPDCVGGRVRDPLLSHLRDPGVHSQACHALRLLVGMPAEALRPGPG